MPPSAGEPAEAGERLFFSIVIPAHNEENYIGETLERIERLSYPKERFEALVVENGSTDRTAETIARHAGGVIRSYTSEQGIARAKNYGLARIAPQSDWVIFLDADTHLAPAFLDTLDAFLRARRDENLAVGTASVRPIQRTRWYAPLWFSCYNLARRFLHVPFTVEIMRASLRGPVRFDDDLPFYEDVQLMKDAERFGIFFYFWTDQVSTSTRRLDHVGWFKILFIWGWGGMVMSEKARKRSAYAVVR